MLDAVRTNPVRIYAVVSAALALAAHYFQDLPVPLILGLVAAILGLGEGVRAKVAPMSKVMVHADEVDEDGAVYIYNPSALDPRSVEAFDRLDAALFGDIETRDGDE